jgi:hypothetical protein
MKRRRQRKLLHRGLLLILLLVVATAFELLGSNAPAWLQQVTATVAVLVAGLWVAW